MITLTTTPSRRNNRFLEAINEIEPEYGAMVKPMILLAIIFMFVWGRWFPETSFEANLILMGGSFVLAALWAWLHVARRRYAQQTIDDQLTSNDLEQVKSER